MMRSHATEPYVEEVEVRGHIVDSLILPKILDCITTLGGHFRIDQIQIGQSRSDPSYARVAITADSAKQLDEILAAVSDHGAVRIHEHDCRLAPADIAAAFPDGFYATTNQATEVRWQGNWLPVQDQEMDCGIVVDAERGEARCVAMSDVTPGQQLVIGHLGVRVFPRERNAASGSFEFMNSAVSSEKPKGVAIRLVAQQLFEARRSGSEVAFVGGPAIIHTGSGQYLCDLIRGGYVQHLFAGNALATHDIEQALYGTSLGVHLERGDLAEAGHEHHLRAINCIRRAGGIRAAVEQGILTSGVMHACVQNHVDVLLAGSIRDDGPLPEVVTDVLTAQREMRRRLRQVKFCLMVATTLHSIAVGNLLPADVDVVCVDINPSTVIKLNDRGSFQTVGIVTDVAPFMRQLVHELELLAQQRVDTNV